MPRAIEPREVYAGIRPGYRQGKRHCNTVELDGAVETTPYARPRDHRTYLLRPLPVEPSATDVVVVMHGGNDLKPSCSRTPAAIADVLTGYVYDVAAPATDRRGQVPATMLVASTIVSGR